MSEPPEMKLLRGHLSRRATSAEFNEWQAREIVAYVDRLREALKQIDVLAEAGRRLDQGIMACDDIRAKVRAALEAKP